MRRHEIKEEGWGRIQDLLPGQPSDPDVAAMDNRLFVNAVLGIAKTGGPMARPARAVRALALVGKWFDRWGK